MTSLVDLSWPICHVCRRGAGPKPLSYDVDLMRELLLDLEALQTSSHSTVVISLDAEAIALGRPVREVEAGLAGLLDLAYIDGPGAETPGFFLFRRLTSKGMQFVETTRRPRDWDRLKRHFAMVNPAHRRNRDDA